MPKLGQEPIYEITRVGRDYEAKTIYRSLSYRTKSGMDVVRYENSWKPLHSASQLKKFVKIKSNRKGSAFHFDGKPYPNGFEAKPFIKDWESSIGRYRTFGPGGM